MDRAQINNRAKASFFQQFNLQSWQIILHSIVMSVLIKFFDKTINKRLSKFQGINFTVQQI